MTTAPVPGVATKAARRRPFVPRVNVMTLLALVPALVVLGLLVRVAVVSFQVSVTDDAFTFDHYVDFYGSSAVVTAARNTLGFSAVTVVVALAFGVPMAWLVERTDLPGKTVIYTVMTLGVLIPGFFTAMGWVFMVHPRIGIVNDLLMDLFGLDSPPLDIVGLPGMGFVQGLGLAAVAFIITVTSLRAMDASLEESALVSGAGRLTVLRRITLPLAMPGLVAAAIFVLTISIATFDVPLIIGLSERILVFSTYLFTLISEEIGGVPRYGVAAAFSAVMMTLGFLLTFLYTRVLSRGRNYQVVTGKNYKPTLIPLGRWRPVALAFVALYLGLAIALPMLTLIWTSLVPFLQPPSVSAFETTSLDNYRGLPWDLVWRSVRNTATLMLAVPTLALLISFVYSWTVLRSKSRFRMAFDYVAFLPQTVPSIIFAFAVLVIVTFHTLGPIDLYGTVTLLVIVMGLLYAAFGTRITNSALVQIHHELEEAGSMAGAGQWAVMRRITLPLIAPAFVYAWLWLSMLSFRELTVPTILFARDNMTLSVATYTLWRGNDVGGASAMNILIILFLVPLIALYWRFGLRGRDLGNPAAGR